MTTPPSTVASRGTFDYIVVGGGTAGCVLASRLSEDRGTRVLVLEAGPEDRSPWIRIPIGFSRLFTDPAANWCYETVEQAPLGGRRIYLPAGRVIGGSSSINGMVYVRGQPRDFDDWARAGATGWDWRSLHPYFLRFEGREHGDDREYGAEGPIGIARMPVHNAMSEAFIDAAAATGLPRRRNLNANPEAPGAGYFHVTTRRGRRSSAASGYLRPARSREGVVVATGATVRRVRFEADRATGVEWEERGTIVTADAAREVLLCAGAIGTPKLLQLSGLGPPELLATLGIPVRVALPGVGTNLHDHYGVRLIAELVEPLSINDAFRRRPHRLVGYALAYAFGRSGQLAIGGAECGGFACSRPDVERPDVQFHFLPLSSERRGWRFHPFSGITANVCVLRPTSRGRVAARSPDPADAPAIDPNYLDTDADRRTIVDAIRLGRRVFAADPLARRIRREVLPGASVVDDDALLGYARANGSTVFHPVGTCRIGVDERAVVGPDLRVRGVRNLRVVDASVMPGIPSGNTCAAVLAIAERAADLVRGRPTAPPAAAEEHR